MDLGCGWGIGTPGRAVRHGPWVWLGDRDTGTCGLGAIPLMSAQMMGQQLKKKKKKTNYIFTLLTLHTNAALEEHEDRDVCEVHNCHPQHEKPCDFKLQSMSSK